MIQFTVNEQIIAILVFFTAVVFLVRKLMLIIEQKSLENSALKKEVEWQKMQNEMIIKEIHVFREKSEEIQSKAMELAVRLCAEESIKDSEFLKDVKSDLMNQENLN